MATTGDVLRLAADHHTAGRLEEAMALYRLVLRVDPVNADGWRLLGKAARAAGDYGARPEWAMICHAGRVLPYRLDGCWWWGNPGWEMRSCLPV